MGEASVEEPSQTATYEEPPRGGVWASPEYSESASEHCPAHSEYENVRLSRSCSPLPLSREEVATVCRGEQHSVEEICPSSPGSMLRSMSPESPLPETEPAPSLADLRQRFQDLSAKSHAVKQPVKSFIKELLAMKPDPQFRSDAD